MIDLHSVGSYAGTRAELDAAQAQSEAWLEALQSRSEDSFPADGLPSLGIEGAGFFTLNDRGSTIFTRVAHLRVAADGSLHDRVGREVLGYASGSAAGAPQPLRVPKADIAAGRFSSYKIDERGIFSGIVRTVDSRSGRLAERQVDLGRLCIALFPAPQMLAAHGADTFAAVRSAGLPQYFPADALRVAPLRRHPLEPSAEALVAHLRRLWSLSGRAEIEAALAAGNNANTRVVLNLVK